MSGDNDLGLPGVDSAKPETPHDRGSFGSKVAVRLASQVAAATGNILIGIIVARYLGAEGKGGVALVRSAGSVAIQVCTLGLPLAATYFVGRKACSLALTARMSAVVSLVLWLVLLAALLLVPTGWLGALGFDTAELVAGLLLIMVVVVPLMSLTLNAAGVLRGREYIIPPAVVNVIGVGLVRLGIVVLALAVLSTGILGVLYADAFYSCFLLLGMGFFLGVASAKYDLGRPRAPRLRAFLSYGAVLQLSRVLQTLFARVDVFILVHFVSRAGVGIYSVAMAASELLPGLAQAVGYVLAPRVALGGDQQGASLTLQVHRLLLLAMAVAVLVVALASPLLPYIYGPAFAASILPMLLCLPGLALWGIANHVWNQFFLGSGRSLQICLVLAVALVVMVSLDLALIPVLGVPGAAVAYSLGALASYVCGFVLFRRATGRPLREAFVVRRADLSLLAGLVRERKRGE